MERELKTLPNDTLESIVYTLLAARARGEHVFCNVFGYTLHSDTVSMDSAYLAVTGQTKAEYDCAREKIKKEYEKREYEMQVTKKIPIWIEQGKNFIFKQKQSAWINCVVGRTYGFIPGKELDAALEIMQALESNATIEQAKQMLKIQQHSNESEGIINNIILYFSRRGPEFIEATAYGELDPRTKHLIELQKRQNILLAQRNEQETYTGPQR